MQDNLFTVEDALHAMDARALERLYGRRFVDKVEFERGGCWHWVASKLPNGYGRFNYDGKPGYAHRFAFTVANGEIPSGTEICHRCDNPGCVNPGHLFAGTRQQNIRDMVNKGRGHWQRNPERAKAMGRAVGAAQKGAAHSRTKLSEKDVAVIKYLLARGAFGVDLAAMFGVHKATIAGIRHGRKWSHVKSF